MIRIADNNHNGDLSVNEMKVMLGGTEHQGFVEWLFFHRDEMFKHWDKDMSGSLEPPELARAIKFFHDHVKAGDSVPLEDEDASMTVARNMIEFMYKHAAPGNVPSFGELFDAVDITRDGTLEEREVEIMLRKRLQIPRAKISKAACQDFYRAIDRDGSGSIERAEFLRFMMKQAHAVSRAFVEFPPPPKGKGGWGGAGFANPEDASIAGGFDWGYQAPYWLIPKTYAEMAADVRR